MGVDVHRGARIAALAHGGQILVSPTTAALLDAHELRDLGSHSLRDFEGATRLAQLGDNDFPPLRTAGSVDLPTPATRFLGRERELYDAVSVVYERDPRVLTILGPGGTGKTRFALELARLLAEDADGGTVFVALAPIRDAELVLATIADRLGAASRDPPALAARIGDRRTHVLCDNLEHLLPDAARPLGELVARAPSLRLLTTSREPLHIQGELEFDLPPLDEAEAVNLFCERAQAVRPDVEETDTVRMLCSRLDCLPLAVELAAARTKVLPPEALLARLGDSLDVLKGARDADDRHATLRTTIAWSYELLDADEQRLFCRLAVFRGGCTLESAERVCDAGLETLASLFDKSLIRRRTGRLGEERFWMLETIREFAAEQLDASGDVDEMGRRHAERMLEIATSAHLSEDDDEPFQLETALAEREDLRAALDWTMSRDVVLAARLAVSLETFWNAHANEEGRERLCSIVTQADALEPGLLSKVLRVAGNTRYNADEGAAKSHWERSLQLCRAVGDDRGAALVLHRMALIPLAHGDIEQSRRMLDESQRLAAGRSQLIEAVNLWMYAQFAFEDGRVEEAISLSRKSAEQADAIGWTWWVSGQRTYLAGLALETGDLDAAEREARAALVIGREHENRQRSAGAISKLAQAAFTRGEIERAGVLWGAAEYELTRTPTRFDLKWFGGRLVTETNPMFRAAIERGRRLSLWDAAGVALGELESPQTLS
ncbi:hypothetical protein BH20ACT13_BH20ACT13_18150 [soil metagenome]